MAGAEIRPIVKWAGGKSRLLPQLLRELPVKIGTYVEPFVGGGALFFALASEEPPRFRRAVLCDANPDLIQCYRAIRDDVEGVIRALRRYRYDKALFYRTRARDPKKLAPASRAARFLFLNRTCFNGLYRVNSKGQFNVPFGRYTNPSICDADALRAASRAFRRASLISGDFVQTDSLLGRGFAKDVVYFDPPYAPVSATANFTSYTKAGFGLADHHRLASYARQLAHEGICVLVSNADVAPVRHIYGAHLRSGFRWKHLKAPRAISCNGKRRVDARELLLVSKGRGRPRP